MSGSAIAIGAVGGALITAVCSLIIFTIQRRTTLRNEHLHRAFEKHLEHYEQIFVSARTAQDSLRDYRAVGVKIEDRSDPFLYQLLAIASDAAQAYCVSVTWTHNPGMLYLDINLEEQCLSARALLLNWLAVRRVVSGDVAFVGSHGDNEPIAYNRVPLDTVRRLRKASYQELRIETRRLVLPERDARQLDEIDKVLTAVIGELKKVMAY
jgi:hypothetical protein